MRLRELRNARGLYQKNIADLLQVDRTTYAKYESGDSEPPLASLIALADFYGVSLDYLAGRDDVKFSPDAAELVEIFSQLSDAGRKIVLGTATVTLQQEGMRKAGPIASEA